MNQMPKLPAIPFCAGPFGWILWLIIVSAWATVAFVYAIVLGSVWIARWIRQWRSRKGVSV